MTIDFPLSFRGAAQCSAANPEDLFSACTDAAPEVFSESGSQLPVRENNMSLATKAGLPQLPQGFALDPTTPQVQINQMSIQGKFFGIESGSADVDSDADFPKAGNSNAPGYEGRTKVILVQDGKEVIEKVVPDTDGEDSRYTATEIGGAALGIGLGAFLGVKGARTVAALLFVPPPLDIAAATASALAPF